MHMWYVETFHRHADALGRQFFAEVGAYFFDGVHERRVFVVSQIPEMIYLCFWYDECVPGLLGMDV